MKSLGDERDMTETKVKTVLTVQEKKIRLQAAIYGFLLGFIVGAIVFSA